MTATKIILEVNPFEKKIFSIRIIIPSKNIALTESFHVKSKNKIKPFFNNNNNLAVYYVTAPQKKHNLNFKRFYRYTKRCFNL